MIVSDKHCDLANDLRLLIQERTETIGDGEGVAMILLWTFLLDHAKCERIDVADLARMQLDAFIPYALKNLRSKRVKQ